MAFTAKLLQIFGQKFYKNVPLSCFLSAIYILADLDDMIKMAAMPIYQGWPVNTGGGNSQR